MKNPQSKYISSVRKVMKMRQIRNIILLSLSVIFALFVLLVLYMSFLQEDIDQTFQNTSPPPSTTISNASDANETETTPISEPDEDDREYEGMPLRDEDPVGFGFFEDTDHYIYETDLFLQTVTYGERDIAYAQLKQNIRKYIEDEPNARISVYYINLHNSEAFGFNDLSPFVFAGTMNLPINIILYDQIAQGQVDLTDLIMYAGPNENDTHSMLDDFFEQQDDKAESATESSEDSETEEPDNRDSDDNPETDTESDAESEDIDDPDKPRLLSVRELSYLSVVHGDATATAMLIEHLGGIESVNERLLSISGAVDFLSVRNYSDYEGVQHSGTQRSSTYDMAHYGEYLYYQYRMRPEIFQPLINDLSRSLPLWGISDGLSGDAVSLNKNGQNTEYDSMSDLAIVIAQEPYILCIAVEANNTAAGQRIIREISEYVDAYFVYCFS